MADLAGMTVTQLSKEVEIGIEPASNNDNYGEALKQLGLKVEDDGYVKWRADNVAHPRNWRVPRKTFDTSLILMLDLFTYLISLQAPRQIANSTVNRTAVSTSGVRSCLTNFRFAVTFVQELS